MLELFRERLEAVDARLHVVEDAAAAVERLVAGATVAAWAEAVSHLLPREVASHVASHFSEDMRAHAAAADVSLIVADVGIAQTGQIGFAHSAARPRDVALLPNRQIALLARENLVADALTALRKVRAPSVVFVAGPSRTADIEQRMMLGVHAPRSLDVIVFG